MGKIISVYKKEYSTIDTGTRYVFSISHVIPDRGWVGRMANGFPDALDSDALTVDIQVISTHKSARSSYMRCKSTDRVFSKLSIYRETVLLPIVYAPASNIILL